MQELYGKLNMVTHQINYTGGSSETATIVVDNKIKRLSTKVLRVPEALKIIRKAPLTRSAKRGNTEVIFDGSSEVTLDLTEMEEKVEKSVSIDELPTVVDLTAFAPKVPEVTVTIETVVYTGQPLTPLMTIVNDDTGYQLVEGVDYTAIFSNNIDAGSSSGSCGTSFP